VPLNRGDRGEWSDVRPQKGKAEEQVGRQRNKLQEDQRHGGARERRQGRSRVRSRYGLATSCDLDEEEDYGYHELGHDGRVTVRYERPARARDCDALNYDVSHVLESRQLPSNHSEQGVVEHTTVGRV